jgi:hypothetical protein
LESLTIKKPVWGHGLKRGIKILICLFAGN